MDNPADNQPTVTATLPTRPVGTVPRPAPITSLPTRPVGARPAQPARAPRRLRWAGIAVLGLAILGGAEVLWVQGTAGTPACTNCGHVIEYPSQGNAHIAPGEAHPAYNSDPPTSGWHREEFAAGYPEKVVFDQPVDDEVTVHMLEHGNAIAWYSCAPGPACTVIHDKLGILAQAVQSRNFLVIPRASLPYHAHVALGAWQHLEYLAGYDDIPIRDFITRFGGIIQGRLGLPPRP